MGLARAGEAPVALRAHPPAHVFGDQVGIGEGMRSSAEATAPKRCRARRSTPPPPCSISSRVRATKFHHISSGSPNGSPPMQQHADARRRPASRRSSRPARGRRAAPGREPVDRRPTSVAVEHDQGVLVAGVERDGRRAPARRSSSTPTRAVSRRAGDVAAAERADQHRRAVRRRARPAGARRGARRPARRGGCASGWATQSCTPWSGRGTRPVSPRRGRRRGRRSSG